ncbi:acyl-CoA/acyl-ACP dehydrogenase [Streptomyces albus]|uniref:acyl-CoA dehydrogenase family protein n=1 Tax=Streptomyces albus TaxID=1888 RepID=UPI0013B48893|nr:acyl-CoA dehydrogenase family protein [Streptomyces albus]QID36836.1 acyl-CoA/acyl-ACP dehydrogenase [Streptomyces albus]
MDTAFTEEQDGIRRTVRDVLARRCTPEDVRAAVLAPQGYDTALWHTLAHELGLPGLALPEAYGGAGCGTLELALAAEEAGRALLPSPLLPTAVLAAPLLHALGTRRQRDRLLPALARGELTATLAVPAGTLTSALGLTGTGGGDGDVTGNGTGPAPWTGISGGRHGRGTHEGGFGAAGFGAAGFGAGGRGADGSGGSWAGGGRAGGIQARPADGGWRLYGEVGQVLCGHTAGLLLVAAHTGGFARSRTVLFLVTADAPGLTRIRQTALDETRPVARLELRDVPAEPLGPPEDDAGPALAAVGPGVAAVLAAEAVGAADGALRRTVAYVGVRHQFGRPIGSFQAVRHRLADVYVRVEAARSAAYYAAWAAGTEAAARAETAAPLSSTLPASPGDGPAVPEGRVNGVDRVNPAEGRANGAGPGEARVDGPLALAQALEALRSAAAETVQLHGGVGFTWEHPAHLAFKRAAGDTLLFGPAHLLRARAAARAGLFAPRTRRASERRDGEAVAV